MDDSVDNPIAHGKIGRHIDLLRDEDELLRAKEAMFNLQWQHLNVKWIFVKEEVAAGADRAASTLAIPTVFPADRCVVNAFELSINDLASLASSSDTERFLSEARTAGRLGHPSIVQVHQVGEVEGQHFYSMEFVEGIDLARLIRREQLDPARIARYLKAVAEAIQHAHENRIIHRDLKPANIILDQNDRPLVGDFGLAKDIDHDRGLTASGASLGTPAYMSPEQAAGKHSQLGPATDIYSLGAILYETLTGRPPFQADTTVDTILQVINREPVPPRSINPGADSQLEAVCLKCLNKNPNRRYQTAGNLAEDLERYLQGDAVLARPASIGAKSWRWLRDVPVIAALTGKRVTNPTIAHHIAQWVLLTSALLLLAVLAVRMGESNTEKPFPSRVRIATGRRSGEYHEFGTSFGAELQRHLSVPVQILSTGGAVENRELLLEDRSELALLQAGAVASEHLAVVAPLYEEFVYFLVRSDQDVQELRDLAEKTVVVGNRGSGMRLSARRLLQKLDLQVRLIEADFSDFSEHPEWDVGIVTPGPRNSALRSLLASEQFRLLPLKFEETVRLTGPVFRPGSIKAGSLASTDGAWRFPPTDCPTVTTTTFLVVHRAASSPFVHAVLEALYGNSELAKAFRLVSRKEAARWPALPLHPAARRFFLANRTGWPGAVTPGGPTEPNVRN